VESASVRGSCCSHSSHQPAVRVHRTNMLLAFFEPTFNRCEYTNSVKCCSGSRDTSRNNQTSYLYGDMLSNGSGFRNRFRQTGFILEPRRTRQIADHLKQDETVKTKMGPDQDAVAWADFNLISPSPQPSHEAFPARLFFDNRIWL